MVADIVASFGSIVGRIHGALTAFDDSEFLEQADPPGPTGSRRLALGLAAGFDVGAQLFGRPPLEGWSFLRGGRLELLYLTILMLALVGITLWTASVGRVAAGVRVERRRIGGVIACSVLAILTTVTSVAPVWRASSFGSDLEALLGGGLVTAAVDLIFLLEYRPLLHPPLLIIGLAVFAHDRATVSTGPRGREVMRPTAPGLLAGLATLGLHRLWRSTLLMTPSPNRRISTARAPSSMLPGSASSRQALRSRFR